MNELTTEDREQRSRLARIINQGDRAGTRSILSMAVSLSLPSIMAQLANILMQYIDATMVGHVGMDAAAAIGLISTSTWLFMGLCSAAATGFAVQVAHLIGARRNTDASAVGRQGYIATFLFSLAIAAAGIAISPRLPYILGGSGEVASGASAYFLIFALSLPIMQLNFLSNNMLRCSGNMLVPGITGVLMCVFDVVFNFFLIFPTRESVLAGIPVTIPGFNLGVQGAALGTGLAMLVATLILAAYLWHGNSELNLRRIRGHWRPTREVVRKAFTLGYPIGIERIINSSAQITLTMIVAPLGAAAIAANAFAVTAEGLCYMPGFGISDAATTMTGQAIGAGKKSLARRFAYITVIMGISVMSVMGLVMYIAAPAIIGIMTPDREIVDLGVMALRIEAWAEPMYAAAIVCYGAFIGAGDTFKPCAMNLASMWVVRITLAAILAPIMGLKGVWVAMCVELCFRGIIFLIRLRSGAWFRNSVLKSDSAQDDADTIVNDTPGLG